MRHYAYNKMTEINPLKATQKYLKDRSQKGLKNMKKDTLMSTEINPLWIDKKCNQPWPSRKSNCRRVAACDSFYCRGTSRDRNATARGDYWIRQIKTKGARSGGLYVPTPREFRRHMEPLALLESGSSLLELAKWTSLTRKFEAGIRFQKYVELFCTGLGKLRVGGLSKTKTHWRKSPAWFKKRLIFNIATRYHTVQMDSVLISSLFFRRQSGYKTNL